jgi:hypothetical protein
MVSMGSTGGQSTDGKKYNQDRHLLACTGMTAKGVWLTWLLRRAVWKENDDHRGKQEYIHRKHQVKKRIRKYE